MENGRERQRSRITIAPESYLPQQQQARYALPCAPERKLLAAVLEDAVKVYQRPHLVRREQYHELCTWLADVDPDDRWPCTFVNICDTLDINPDAARAAIHAGHGDTIVRSLRIVESRPNTGDGPGAARRAPTSPTSPRWVA